jgi:hypothetical protein
MTQRTSPKTPYEIRLELLELAQVILQADFEARDCAAPHEYPAPTTEQIIAEAEKMNAFVSKANTAVTPSH